MQVSNSVIHSDKDKHKHMSIYALHCFFCFFFLALQADRDTPVHTFCAGVHIPAALMLQAQRGQQLCRYNYSGWILHLSLCLGNCVWMSCFYVNIVVGSFHVYQRLDFIIITQISLECSHPLSVCSFLCLILFFTINLLLKYLRILSLYAS